MRVACMLTDLFEDGEFRESPKVVERVPAARR